MVTSAYASTRETTYNNRINRVLLGPCTDQLRDVLRRHVSPVSFPNVIVQHRTNLPHLTAPQRDLILPRTGHYSGNYSDMDISLLYLLLRNICSLPEHDNGWGNSPRALDFTLSANIERIREARNKIGHSSKISLSQADFHDIWNNIDRAVISMDIYLNNSNKYKREMDFLLTETMDPEREDFYKNLLIEPIHGIHDLQNLIRTINESEADRIQILPLKTDDTMAVDRIYVPVLISDGNKMRTNREGDQENISNIASSRMFHVNPGKLARFVFMLGEAGYGKTVQCQRITKLWCQSWEDEHAQTRNKIKVTELEKSLKEFDFLFFVRIREVNAIRLFVKDMICDAYSRYNISRDHLTEIRGVLEDENSKCLILIDGLDEWNIPDNEKICLLNKGLPNCDDMPGCTVIFTMRSWKFMEVEHACRPRFDNVVKLLGLDNNGIEQLTTNMLCNYFHLVKDSNEFKDKYKRVMDKAFSVSFELKSLMNIPLLAVFCILTWYEDIDTGTSLTTFYLSMLEALIKRSLQVERRRDDNFEWPVPSILVKFWNVTSRMPELTSLGKITFERVSAQSNTLIFSAEELTNQLGKETLNYFQQIGLLSKSQTWGKIHEDNVRISFLHKTIQDFISSLYLFYGKQESDIVNFVCNSVLGVEKALELSNILIFLSGLSSVVGCKISNHIRDLSSEDKDILEFRDHYTYDTSSKVFLVFLLQMSCYREVRKWKSIENCVKQGLQFSLSDIILFGNQMDSLTIRESAEILHYHANDIKLLYMLCIPNDSEKGITNVELKEFFDKSHSIESFNIDGYANGECRLFDVFSKQVSCLYSLGLKNVAFPDTTLTDVLTKEQSMKNIKTLGLFYMKSTDDLAVDYQYQFCSLHRLLNGYNFLRRRKAMSFLKQQEKPLLRDILDILPKYRSLSTFYISYMTSEEDRQFLLKVLPKMRTLQRVGYWGTSIYPNPDNAYDNAVIEILMEKTEIKSIHLDQIIRKDKVLNFERMSEMELITLRTFKMNPREWKIFVKSLSNIGTLCKVILHDTNIDKETFHQLKRSSRTLTLLKEDSTEW